jgi:hypothetical protein
LASIVVLPTKPRTIQIQSTRRGYSRNARPIQRNDLSNLAGAAEHRLPIRQVIQTRSQCQPNAVSTAARGSRTITSEPSRQAGSPPESRRPRATRGGGHVRERTAGPGERPPEVTLPRGPSRWRGGGGGGGAPVPEHLAPFDENGRHRFAGDRS